MTRTSASLQKELRKHLDLVYSRRDAEEYAARLAEAAGEYRQRRSAALKAWDDRVPGDWFRSHQRVAYSLYAHLFAAAPGAAEPPLQRLAGQLGYFQDLGVDVIHVLPFLKSSIDDGFGVDDYGAVDERLGSKDDLEALVRACHERDIFVAADFVLNHVSSNHEWARWAEDGGTIYERFFYWDKTNTGDPWPGVFEMFPEFAPGHWDYVPKRDRWVWATFYKRWPKGSRTKAWPAGQWDLNYHEPEVLLGMVENLLELANWGIDVFRLDAVAFIWKQRGTACENLDEVYALLAVFHLCLKAVAPKAAMLAELNAPPQYLQRYFQAGGELAYHFPALPGLWEAVRLGRVRRLRQAFEGYRQAPTGVLWLFNECHDELNLGALGREQIEALSALFWGCGGVPFRCPLLAECGICRPSAEACFRHGDRHPTGVCGTSYSLLGGPEDDAAAARLRLMWLLKLSLGGTPLFYMGEELGTLTAPQALGPADRHADTRSVKRLPLTVEQVAARGGEGRRFFDMLQRLIAWRKENAYLMAAPGFVDAGSESVLGFTKLDQGRTVYFLANCSDRPQLAAIAIGDASGGVEAAGPPGSEACAWEQVRLGSTNALVVELPPYAFQAWAVRR